MKKSSSKINFKEIGDKLNLKTKKDLKILKKKLRKLKERGKLTTSLNNYTTINVSNKDEDRLFGNCKIWNRLFPHSEDEQGY